MELKFEPLPKQWQMFEAFDDPTTLQCLYGGSVGSAKSYGLCAMAIIKAYKYKQIRILLGRNQLKNLKQTTLVSFFEVCHDFGLKPDVHYRYNQATSEITFTNGSVIILKELQYIPSDPEYQRIGGLLLTFACIDEASEVNIKALEIVSSRCGRWKNNVHGIKGITFMTCNPSRGHVYENFYKPWSNGTLPPHRKFIQALPGDNKYLAASYLESLKLTLSRNEYSRLVLGNWEGHHDPDCLTTYDQIMEMYDYKKPEKWKGKWFITADIAFESDKCIVILWNGLDVVQILEVNKQNKPEDIILKLQEEYRVRRRNVCWDGIGAGNYLKNYFKGGYAFIAGAKPIKEKTEFVHLKDQCYYRLAEGINTGKIRIFDTSLKDEVVDELLQIKTVPKEKIDNKIKLIKKKDIKQFIGRSPDILDALSMRMVYELKANTDYYRF